MSTFKGFPQSGYPYSAGEAGRVFAALIAKNADGTPKGGVLGVAEPLVTAVAGAWKVQVRRFPFVQAVGDGVEISGVDAPEQHNIASAAGIAAGQGRIDVVTWNAVTSQIGVVQGAVSASPAAPDTPGVARLATVRVDAGDASVQAAKITDVATRTQLAASAAPASGVVASGEFVPALAGAPGASGGTGYQDLVPVVFDAALPSIPKIRLMPTTPWGYVQWYQVTSVSTTGFALRAIRLGTQPAVAGVKIAWEAVL